MLGSTYSPRVSRGSFASAAGAWEGAWARSVLAPTAPTAGRDAARVSTTPAPRVRARGSTVLRVGRALRPRGRIGSRGERAREDVRRGAHLETRPAVEGGGVVRVVAVDHQGQRRQPLAGRDVVRVPEQDAGEPA